MAVVVVFGAGGTLGSRVVTEAAGRGHAVTAVLRDPAGAQVPDGVATVAGDATSAVSVRGLVAGEPAPDVLVCCVGGPDKSVYLRAAETLVAAAVPLDPAPRIIHCGGGGSLLDDHGVRLVDTPGFPDGFREEVLGQAAALDCYRQSTGVTWTYLSPPPGNFAPGERRGTYRVGTDHPVVGADGTASLSYEDLAVALVDEIERPAHLDQRFTVGY